MRQYTVRCVLLLSVCVFCPILFCDALVTHRVSDNFEEDLTLTPLSDGKLLAHFEFTTDFEAHVQPGTPISDYGLFPKAIGQVLQEYDVREMHLTFTQGRWNYGEWGYCPSQSAGTGVELWAWMKNSANVDAHWKSFTNVLSGLFCASLNFIDETLTTEPRLSFQPEAIHDNPFLPNTTNSQLRYGSLPHENSGIAVLLNAHKIYNSNFHSMAIHAKSSCMDETCSRRRLELKQTVTSVMDPVRETDRRDWSLQSIFDRQLTSACPVARQSRALVALNDEIHQTAQLSPSPHATLPADEASAIFSKDKRPRSLAVYDLKKVTGHLDISMSWNEAMFQYPREAKDPMISAQRYFTGYGQERGGLRITIENRNEHESVPMIYYDSIPWFLKFYLHTLEVDVIGNTTDKDDIIQEMYYQPAIDRGRPTMLECRLLIPAKSMVTLSLDFDKVFLKYTEHRPDANRGFDVGSAVLTMWMENNTNSRSPRTMRLYTDTLLVSLPTPDFSMPYNVITLTCTVIALFFGSLFNLLIRSFQVVEPEAKTKKDD
ncbi:GPI transamidase component PIG-T [Radiomyces spectabilis]|uniref:GPI transamidase component PIG-T n=1 Tax=Radiomyces spectabilis TaxID=64574 RepID=UPI002220E81F|nr:GPI transamidase component PIG-T [Radiomyces spectabilis]KAI8391522.1 GPI transamidase component PIG-T [Radiomyces spectabilis]